MPVAKKKVKPVVDSYTETLCAGLRSSAVALEGKYFNMWKTEKNPETRNVIYAKLEVLDDMVKMLTNQFRNNK